MSRPLGLFEAFGIEIELTIVDAESLDVRPIADQLLADEAGAIEDEIERGRMAWSNELARHVIEVKTNGPVPRLAGVADDFAGEVARMHALLADRGARLMPGGVHPWMDPAREFERWPHGGTRIYETFDRIFDCRGHGWANLQSVHVNLPFRGAAEFGRLHAAIRAALPLLPALAASSPVLDGRAAGWLDARLEVYRGNARRVPSVAGRVIPEPCFTPQDYARGILEPVYRDLAPLDPEGVLRHEWVNSRGCIARFDRDAIEIRVLDTQENPRADLAVASAVVALVRRLADDDPARQERLRRLETERLAALLEAIAGEADETRIDDAGWLEALGLAPRPTRARDAWAALLEAADPDDAALAEARPRLDLILDEGCLARRLLRAVGGDWRRGRLHEVWGALCDALRDDRPFRA